jgi:Uncharacterised protein family (UPF0158)
MPLPVSVDEVADALEMVGDQITAYVNRKTGEIVTVSDDDMELADDEELDETDLPAWQAEMLPRLREILQSEDWAALPSKFDIHEWDIMRRFAQEVRGGGLGDRLQNAIRGKGAFRMFRDVVDHAGRRDEWFAFRREALKTIAREALEDLGIPFK